MCVMARILVKAIENGEENLAKDIIQCESYTEKDSHSSKTVDTALFFCCSRGFLELAKLLIEKGANVASTGKNLATPLHAAVDNGHLNVVRLLLEHGADVNSQNYRGDTSLHLAAYRGYGQIIQCLMESGADCRLINGNSFTAENEAFVHGHRDLGCYLRLESSVRYPKQFENNFHPMDFMIQLDCPSVAVNPSHQKEYQKQELENDQPCEEQHKDSANIVLKQKPDCSVKTESCDYETKKFHNLLFLPLDPPAVTSPSVYTLRDDKSLKEHTTGKAHSLFRDSTNTNNSTQESPKISSCIFPHKLEVPSQSITGHSNLNSRWQTDALLINKLNSASIPPRNMTCQNYCESSQRRPSTCSTSSYFSDVSFSTGSDCQSFLSNGSDASLNFYDYRHEDLDIENSKFENNCQETQDEDLMFLSLGVRNPPSHKSKIGLLTNFEPTEPPEFSHACDSTLFSLRPAKYRPTILPVSKSSSDIKDLLSDNRKNKFSPVGFEKNDPSGITISLPDNGSCSSPNRTFTVCPEYDSYSPTNLRSTDFENRNSGYGFFPGFKRMFSNDLSSLTDKTPISMTRVNIPLN